jgi:hypothetical protein
LLSRSDHEDALGDRRGERVRRHCRNVRCGGKLKVPTERMCDAFCCSGCYASFYRFRCLVCERPFDRKTERRQLCGRPKCKRDFQRHTERFCGVWYQRSVLVRNALGDPIKSGLKNGDKPGRAFRQVAGPTLSEDGFRLATLPLELGLVARLARVHAEYFEHRRKARRLAERNVQIKRKHPPVNILGGFRFPGATAVDMSPTERAAEWAITSRWVPVGVGADVPEIPDFLRRCPPNAATAKPTPTLAPTRARARARAPAPERAPAPVYAHEAAG